MKHIFAFEEKAVSWVGGGAGGGMNCKKAGTVKRNVVNQNHAANHAVHHHEHIYILVKMRYRRMSTTPDVMDPPL